MPRYDFQRSQAHRRWRQRKTTIVVAALVLTLVVCAWFALVYSSHSPYCWQRVQEWQEGPVSFHWEDELLPLAPLQGAVQVHESNSSAGADLSLRNIVFSIAGSVQLWPKRKEYVKLWWRPDEMLGFVWLEEKTEVTEEEAGLLPQVLISEDISRFRYTHSTGHPSGVRIARIIQEVFRLGLPDVRWFVLGDDDTVFSPDNLVRVLKKYDHNEMYYIGNPSESHSSNTYFSHGMAFGGGGIAISYPLAEILSKMLDECLERYTSLFGSDDRLHACITELGIPLTKEAGFHQFDVHGNAFGLLAAHPTSPFISMHHLDEVDPLFPKLDALSSLRQLANAMHTEPRSFLQQCICYDRGQKLSLSISLGFVVQVFPYVLFPRELERPEITFKAWNSKGSRGEFDLDTRRSLKPICRRPFVFYLENMYMQEDETVLSIYKRDTAVDERKRHSFCFSRVFPPEQVEKVRVLSKRMSDQWFLAPRRQCCKVTGVKDKVLGIMVSPCQYGKFLSR
eukprot:c25332_g2_i1 orf=212-1735(+)